MPLSKSASGKGRQDLSGTSWKAPKCKEQGEAEDSQVTGLKDTPMENSDTSVGSSKGTAQASPYKYDRLPCLDDEPAGGLR